MIIAERFDSASRFEFLGVAWDRIGRAGPRGLDRDRDLTSGIFQLGILEREGAEDDPAIGMDMHLWVLATPVDGTLIDMVLIGQVRELNKPKRSIVGMRFLTLSGRSRRVEGDSK